MYCPKCSLRPIHKKPPLLVLLAHGGGGGRSYFSPFDSAAHKINIYKLPVPLINVTLGMDRNFIVRCNILLLLTIKVALHEHISQHKSSQSPVKADLQVQPIILSSTREPREVCCMMVNHVSEFCCMMVNLSQSSAV